MKLPNSTNLPIKHLAAVFNKTTNSYKFYWFLAILENIKYGKTKINIDSLIIDMIGEVWYPINYFKLSFGRQDQFEKTVIQIQQKFDYPKDINKLDLIEHLRQNKEISEIKQLTYKLSRWVPQRFLRPWFADELRGMKDQFIDNAIKEMANRDYLKLNYSSLYRFTDGNTIKISSLWKDYLVLHLKILKGYTYWYLINYLQKRNPNTTNIPIKLFPPEQRKLTNARKFWDLYISSKNYIQCIYSAQPIVKDKYSIDHFLPWSFTAHDLLWNLVPTTKEVNSSKSDNLPAENYLNDFVTLQYNAFHTVVSIISERNKLLEDYSVLFKRTLNEISAMEKNEFSIRMLDSIKPQLQIAKNMGFQYNWIYKK